MRVIGVSQLLLVVEACGWEVASVLQLENSPSQRDIEQGLLQQPQLTVLSHLDRQESYGDVSQREIC